MATHIPCSRPLPGAMYVNITPRLQAFYTARGMWLNGAPAGALTAMLGAPAPWCSYQGLPYFVSTEQLAALTQDILANGRRGMNGHQFAQALRRLREAATRAGEQPPALTPSAAVAATPFEPLLCPPSGTKARKAFEQHLMTSLREVVAYSQESVYTGA